MLTGTLSIRYCAYPLLKTPQTTIMGHHRPPAKHHYNDACWWANNDSSFVSGPIVARCFDGGPIIANGPIVARRFPQCNVFVGILTIQNDRQKIGNRIESLGSKKTQEEENIHHRGNVLPGKFILFFRFTLFFLCRRN